MRRLASLFIMSLLASCSVNHIYIVRHAEKAAATGGMNAGDPMLSEAGLARATALEQRLAASRISLTWATPYLRTRNTAQPVATHFNIAVLAYPPVPKPAFIDSIRRLRSNMLFVGHSNTVDDLVNGISGSRFVPGDLDESVYDRLYIITHRGRKWKVRLETYGRIN